MSSLISSSFSEAEWLSSVGNVDLDLPFTRTYQITTRDSCGNHPHAPDKVSQCDVQDGSDGRSKQKKDDFGTGTSPWRPWSLQRRTIYLFMVVFEILAIALETIFFVSEKNQGLATVFSGVALHYSWTYGTPAVFSAMSAVWMCIDYSAKASAPWIRIRNAKNKRDTENALLLDYLVPFHATKNRDFLVAATTLVSLILTAMSVFAPSLIRLAPVDVSVPVQPLSKFVDDPTRLDVDEFGRLSLYNMIGLKQFNLTNQPGISDSFVYQSFDTSPDLGSELNVTVDALSVELYCEPASLNGFSYTYDPMNTNTITPRGYPFDQSRR